MFKPTWIVISLLALACVAEGIALWQLDGRLAELEATTKRAVRRSVSRAAPSGSPEAVTAESVRVIDERITALEKVRESLRPAPMDLADGETPGTPARSVEQRLEELVDRKLDERLKESPGEKLENKNPSIRELSKAVAMTPEQEDASVRAIDEGKKLSFELLSLPRADGTSMADELIAALKSEEDPGKVWGGFIQRLMTERVPGKNQTYLAGIMQIQKGTWERLSRTLDEDQQKKLKRMGVDILEVKTGYEPFEDLLSER